MFVRCILVEQTNSFFVGPFAGINQRNACVVLVCTGLLEMPELRSTRLNGGQVRVAIDAGAIEQFADQSRGRGAE